MASPGLSINTGADDEMKKIESSVGVAFSGGGIRSAAFSSGVLRRLLHRCVPVDFISTVSGGGYTGSAYLDWKYRHGGKDHPKWHEQFFNQMRRNANTLCSWNNPIRGIFDVFSIIMMIICIGIVIPVLLWVPIAFPVTYVIDSVFGDILRNSFICRWDAGFNETVFVNSNETRKKFPGKIHPDSNCFPFWMKGDQATPILFGSLGLIMIFFYGCYKLTGSRIKDLFRIFAIFALILLSFTFVPWAIEMFASSRPTWIDALLLCFGFLLWMGIPPLREISAWCLLIYFYAFVIKWRLFKNPLWGVQYKKKLFLDCFWSSVAIFLITPILWLIQQNSIHAFWRSKLQKAFYTRQSAGVTGCEGITISDFLPLSRPAHKMERSKSLYEEIDGSTQPLSVEIDDTKHALSLGDLSEIKPTYICNVLVDNWKYKSTRMADKESFTILTLTPHLIERIDDDEVNDFTENFIGPYDVELSDAMATSAAVVSKHMGHYSNQSLLSVQNLLGLTMGKSWISDKRYFKGYCRSLLIPFIIQLVVTIPLVILPIYEVHRRRFGIADEVFLGIFLSFMFVFVVLSLLPTGESAQSKFERFTRWCIINIFQVRYMREVLQINNVGEVPPAILYLSDGGHVENLGMLALLKRRLRRIIVADGGFNATEYDVAESLLMALKMAREKLHCSFKGMDGRDIEEDIRDRFIEKVNGKHSRFYRFRVDYYEKTKSTNYETKWVGEGQIIFLAPRHPKDCAHIDEDLAWEKLKSCHLGEMKRDRWGTSPLVTEDEVDQLTVGCCECCHVSCCQSCSDPICGKFPQHVTANQFFTPAMFSAYHREGYTAALQAAVAEFVAEDNV